ncbi:dockerin type I repeat protein [Anaerobacterium chartisolvens]|uniref:Dockerin type I repeat protein n=1 Tax=Anaerobacterium chartisolvens TaxID=1297424 RepID=A0A369ANT3_9FIRM|nr:glycoside hydrolase family 9 protein [Anaerobacterium chartisolvens]RCX09104.1 dockerin type I repeat protein [Anaerobacterium chartisolvens]
MRKKIISIILLTAILLTLAIPPIAAGASAPEGWRKLADYTIFNGGSISGWSGSGGGELETVNSNLPVDTDVTYNGMPSLRLNVSQYLSSGWWISLITVRDWCTHDFSQYVPNGFLEFQVKGKLGGEYFQIGLRDKVYERSSVEERDVAIDVTRYNEITTDWVHFKIPLKDIIGVGTDFDPSNVNCLVFDKINTMPFTVWISDVKITSPDNEKSYGAVKVNQVGFIPDSEKYALVTDFEDQLQADAGSAFQVRNSSDGSIAYEGILTLVEDYEATDSGERILKADFSELSTPGQYYISVSAPGIEDSAKFKISNDAYKSIMVDASRYFYYQRTGLDLEEENAPDYPRKDITPMDAQAGSDSDASVVKDVSKGWYDAGDKGKYVNAGATAVSDLLWAYEMFPSEFKDNQFNIPESGNGIADILDEVKWELDWILKMQDSVSGGFYARVQSDNDEKVTRRTIKDREGSRRDIKPTDDTACAAAALSHAYIIYKDINPDFAGQCLEAAKNAWTYLENNPGNIKSPSGPYSVSDDRSDRLWAAASLYRACGEQKYNDYFKNNYRQFAQKFESSTSYGHTWADNWSTAFFSYMKAQSRDSQVEGWFAQKFGVWLDNILNRYEGNPWKNAIVPGNYFWGINMQVLNVPMDAYIGSVLLDTYDEQISKLGFGSLNWLLGTNPLRKSYVSGHGENSIKTVYSTIYSLDKKPGIPNGYMAGGPNNSEGKGISRFAAKAYMESATDWVTNEHTVYWNSPLVFMTAFATYNGEAQEEFIYGDVNGDKQVNSVDFSLIRQYLIEKIEEFPDENGRQAADVNGDGSINSIDFALLRQYLLGIITEFPAEV